MPIFILFGACFERYHFIWHILLFGSRDILPTIFQFKNAAKLFSKKCRWSGFCLQADFFGLQMLHILTHVRRQCVNSCDEISKIWTYNSAHVISKAKGPYSVTISFSNSVALSDVQSRASNDWNKHLPAAPQPANRHAMKATSKRDRLRIRVLQRHLNNKPLFTRLLNKEICVKHAIYLSKPSNWSTD